MIVSSYELSLASERVFSIPKSRGIDVQEEPPAKVRVLVEVHGHRGVAAAPEVNVLLYIRNLAAFSPREVPASVVESLPLNLLSAMPDYTEVHRARLNPGPGATQLQFGLESQRAYELRVEFYDRDTGNGESAPLCFADFTLPDLLAAPGESIAAPLHDFDSKLPAEGRAQLSVVWMREWVDRLVFEVKVKINKRLGWPFSTTRPFFCVYILDGRREEWVAVYRSEVLTAVSDHPQAEGSMYFQLAEVQSELAHLDRIQDNRPIRIEVFHYKTTGISQMIASMETTKMYLRQVALDHKLDMAVTSFQQGELVGSIVLRKRILTANTSFYSFLMEFGGDVAGDCLYLNLSVDAVRDRRFSGLASSRVLSKPFYYLRRSESSGAWLPVYKSEVARKSFGNSFDFKLTRISLKRLNGNVGSRPFEISFHRDSLRQKNPLIGYVKTTEDELRMLPLKATLSILDKDGNYKGSARVEQKEIFESRLLVSLVCLMGGTPPPIGEAHEPTMNGSNTPSNQVSPHVSGGSEEESS